MVKGDERRRLEEFARSARSLLSASTWDVVRIQDVSQLFDVERYLPRGGFGQVDETIQLFLDAQRSGVAGLARSFTPSWSMTDSARSFTPSWSMTDIARSLTPTWPVAELTRILPTAWSIANFARLTPGPRDGAFRDAGAEFVSRILEDWATASRIDFARIRRRIFPANLAGLKDLTLDEIDRLAEEGITLYVVPRPETARKLVRAPDTAARRGVLGTEFFSILDDCEAVLDLCIGETTRVEVPLVRHAIAAARDGHTSAAQALAANTLDTLLQRAFPKKERIALTSHRNGRPAELDDLRVRWAWVMVPIWWAYRPFCGHAGKAAPTAFSRHATVHGVSGRQFSKRNTVQAMMLATSFIAVRNRL